MTKSDGYRHQIERKVIMDNSTEFGNLFLGNGVVANGVAMVPGSAVLNGQFDGALNAKIIEVQQQGILSGTTQAASISVAGKLNNSIEATDVLTIANSGVVSGDIAYGKLEIAKGGQLLGTIKQL